jgi:hypothetical protein
MELRADRAGADRGAGVGGGRTNFVVRYVFIVAMFLLFPLFFVCAAAILIGAAALVGAVLALVTADHRNPCVRWFADWVESHTA